MKKVDIPQVLISTAAIFGIGLIWYDFNLKVFYTVRDLMKATLFDPDAEEDTLGIYPRGVGYPHCVVNPTEETNN